MSKSAPEDCCGACEYWFALGDADSAPENGRCRRYPPQLSLTGQVRWPVTHCSHGCGEFALNTEHDDEATFKLPVEAGDA